MSVGCPCCSKLKLIVHAARSVPRILSEIPDVVRDAPRLRIGDEFLHNARRSRDRRATKKDGASRLDNGLVDHSNLGRFVGVIRDAVGLDKVAAPTGVLSEKGVVP